MLGVEHMTSLFENATEGIVVANGDGKILIANPSAERMFGYSREKLEGQPIEILIPDELKARHHQVREGFYKSPSNRVMGHGRDLYGRKSQGEIFPVEVSLSHYRQNDEMFVIAFIVDITHRKMIEADVLKQQQELEKISHEMREMNTQLEIKVEERTTILKEALKRLEQSQEELKSALDKERQLNEIKSRFVSMASHEFRTPLSTVLSSASLLGKYTSGEEQDKRTRHIEKIKGSVKQLNDILEDFLSLGKLDEGKVESQLESFNLEDCIKDVVDELSPSLKKDQLITRHLEGGPQISTDKKLLKNILLNLISNAIKFSKEGTEIEIWATVQKNKVTIKVKDQGIGISQEDQHHLFSSFFRGANATNIQGTGLGLHIVKRYVSILNGSVHLDSSLGKGTTVNISFPSNPA